MSSEATDQLEARSLAEWLKANNSGLYEEISETADLLVRQAELIEDLREGASDIAGLLVLIGEIRSACGDFGKRQPDELVEHIRAGFAERDQLLAERDAAFAMSRCECNSDEACANLAKLHADVERLREFFDADMAVAKIYDEVSPGLTSPKGAEWSDRVEAAIARRCAAVIAIEAAKEAK